MMSDLPVVRVVAAVIVGAGRVLATRRGYGEWKGWWEFPGGKVEPGEAGPSALRREISEELAVDIEVEELVATVDYDYPAFHLSMECYHCRIVAGELQLLEHEDSRLLPAAELHDVGWLPADREILPAVAALLGSGK